MYCISPSFVLGFHGCERDIGERVLAGEETLLDSTNDYDWLGRGAYFWENNPQRALSFATNAQKRRSIRNPFVIKKAAKAAFCSTSEMDQDKNPPSTFSETPVV